MVALLPPFMIQKSEIQERRKHIAEVRHAEGVYRDIQARENERADFEKRWFWELLQNAKDSIDAGDKVTVRLDIQEDEISFSHTGNPFELDDILSLIIQGSSKSKKEGKTGRFGTGFMTTYLLSKEVTITGELTDQRGYFSFLLDRNATDSDQFVDKQKLSNESFDNSVRTETYLNNTPFKTKFTYRLDDQGKHTAQIGLESLDELIPITQLFNEEIESVIVTTGQTQKTFTKTFKKTFVVNNNEIKEWSLDTILNGKTVKSLNAYVFYHDEFQACITTYLKDGVTTIAPLGSQFPRLFFTFPLIGTEEIGIPIIINSINFEPRVERDGVYLRKANESIDGSKSKTIIKDALHLSLTSFASLFIGNQIQGMHELFSFQIAKDLKWIDHEWFNHTKIEITDLLASLDVIRYHTGGELFTNFSTITIPHASQNSSDQMWSLVSNMASYKVPLHAELDHWKTVLENTSQIQAAIPGHLTTKFAFNVKDIIHFVEERKTFLQLTDSLRTPPANWLNDFYSLVKEQTETFPLDKRIILNQDLYFRKAEGMFWDDCRDEELISISKLNGLNFSAKLIANEINRLQLVGVENFSTQHAIKELKGFNNNPPQVSLTSSVFSEANARLLRWLIHSHEEDAIKDLKIMTGPKQDAEIDFNTFSKQDSHLLLAPKKIFGKSYPLYADLIRDRDCLNEVYSKFLTESNFKFLNDHGFIHLEPFVVHEAIADKRILEYLIADDADLKLLKDSEGQINQRIKLTYTDFAYLTATDHHIYGRNTTQKSSLERFKFLLLEAVEKDSYFESNVQFVTIEGIAKPIKFHQCLWIYRARKLPWVHLKSDDQVNENKETPSSKNLSELIKNDETLIKEIRGVKQQLLLNRLGVGVSDLIRNTLATDDLKLSWDKAITNMITSDADPELVQEIFDDPGIKKEFERKLTERKLIKRNQDIGKLVETLFQKIIMQQREKGIPINIKREPFGSDYLLSEDSSDLVNEHNQHEVFQINNWLVELKATSKDYAAMTELQAKTATSPNQLYALIVVPLSHTAAPLDLAYVEQNARIITHIGEKLTGILAEFKDVELKRTNLNHGLNGISVLIEDQKIRFIVNATHWQHDAITIEQFLTAHFTAKV